MFLFYESSKNKSKSKSSFRQSHDLKIHKIHFRRRDQPCSYKFLRVCHYFDLVNT